MTSGGAFAYRISRRARSNLQIICETPPANCNTSNCNRILYYAPNLICIRNVIKPTRGIHKSCVYKSYFIGCQNIPDTLIKRNASVRLLLRRGDFSCAFWEVASALLELQRFARRIKVLHSCRCSNKMMQFITVMLVDALSI
jgi:hypothetical protein